MIKVVFQEYTPAARAAKLAKEYANDARALGDLAAHNTYEAFARSVTSLQIETLIDAARIAHSWADLASWESQRYEHKGDSAKALASQSAAGALVWLAEALIEIDSELTPVRHLIDNEKGTWK